MDSGLHIYDLFNSEKIGSRQLKPLLKNGWSLYRLEARDSYCSFGAAGIYEFCVWDGNRELRQITNKALSSYSDLENLPFIKFNQDLMVLKVPYDRKDEMHSTSACWNPFFGHWVCQPKDKHQFESWLPQPIIIVNSETDRTQLDVPWSDAKEVTELGAFRAYTDEGKKAFFCFSVQSDTFKKWLPPANQ